MGVVNAAVEYSNRNATAIHTCVLDGSRTDVRYGFAKIKFVIGDWPDAFNGFVPGQDRQDRRIDFVKHGIEDQLGLSEEFSIRIKDRDGLGPLLDLRRLFMANRLLF